MKLPSLKKDVAAGHLDVLLEKLGEVQVVPLIAHLVSRQQLTLGQIDELQQLIAEARTSQTAGKGKRNSRRKSKGDKQ